MRIIIGIIIGVLRLPAYSTVFAVILVAFFPPFSMVIPPFMKHVNAQILGPEDLITYSIPSNFIKEFKVPLQELGLKGITTDAIGNAWFYHSTNQSSTILVFNITTQQFRDYEIEGKTLVDPVIVNLAGGQIIYDDTRNAICFTEITGNKLGKLDIESISSSENISNINIIKEYPVFEQSRGQTSGPALLTFFFIIS